MPSKKNLAKAPAAPAAGRPLTNWIGRTQRVDFGRALNTSGRRMPDCVLPNQLLTMKTRRPNF